MNAVGVLGRYISKGVYTVSGPFHPFGGAVDIVVVEQPDGSFKSSPWYVRFGKFQGVLKTKEKVVHVIVNGVEADLNMYLDAKGEAYFLREVDVEGESVSYPSSSGDETDGKLQQEQDGRGILSSKGSNYDTESSIVDIGVEKNEDSGKIAVSTSSRRSRILGFVWGRKSVKEDDYQDTSVARVGSLERAEIAANLLDVRWSTNIKPQKFGKEETSRFSSIDTSDGKDKNELKIDDGDNHVSSAVEGNMGNGPDNQMGDERCDNSSSEQIDNGHQYALKKQELSVEVTREMSNSNTKHQAVETSIVEEKVFNETYEVKSEISREVIQVTLNDQDTENAMGIIPENTGSDSQISLLRDCDTYYEENFNGEHYSDETDIVSQGFSISEDKNISGGVQSLEFCGTSEISIMKVDDSRAQAHKTFADGGCGIVGIQVEQLHASMEVHSVDTVSTVVAADFEMETEEVEIIENYSQQTNPYNTSIYDGNTIDQEEPVTCPDSFTEVVSTDPIPCSIKEVKSNSISSSFSSDLQDEEGVDGSVTSKCQNSLNSICHSVTINESRMIPPTNSDEEQFLFSDFDVFETKVIRNMESDSQHLDVEEDYPLVHPDGINEENRFVNRNVETCPSPDSHEIFKESTTSPITIPQSHPISNEEVEHLVASLPNLRTGIVGSPIACEIYHPLSCSVDSNPKSLKWMKLCKGDPSFKSGGDKEQVAEAQLKIEESQISEELNSILPDLVAGSPAESTVEPVGSWKPWPFTLQRSRSRKMTQSDIDGYSNFGTEKNLDRNLSNATDGAANIIKHKAERKVVRSISPTSEQLASLNLKEGGNTVTFTFSTSMLGKQQVDARIYLWKWDTRVVISDVDGTITKSDVLGQFMPFVGMDWSQTGVVHFFSAIKENGYQFLFLSARSISQAYTTRQFLFNLKQNGKALPEGPVVISPDGLFPSLYREVIRRAPHEFKIACLERIRDLFPPDCNPFYAGFGNRDTDEISYLKVGIPKGKIFIINPKGEVAVNRRIDTKSYTSLHTLVNRIFPSMTSSEQEDFNSWNYWKLSPFTVD